MLSLQVIRLTLIDSCLFLNLKFISVHCNFSGHHKKVKVQRMTNKLEEMLKGKLAVGAATSTSYPDLAEDDKSSGSGSFSTRVSIALVGDRLVRDFQKELFPITAIDLAAGPHPLTCVTVAYKTSKPNTAVSDDWLAEREKIFADFISKAKMVVEHIKEQQGCWADFIDTSSGAPFYTDSSTSLLEVDERMPKLNKDLKIMELGCCKAVVHSEFGSSCIVGTIFTKAPEIVIRGATAILK